MICVEFPVSPITRKILLSEYGAEPIQLRSHDITFQKLCYKHPRPRSNVKRLKSKLTTSIKIKLHKDIAKNLGGNGYQIGYHLLCHHMDVMMRHVYSQVLVNIPATTAMQSFYKEYNIDEDDLPFETAYKRWQRYQEMKKDKNFRINVRKNIRQDVLRNSKVLKLKVPLAEDYLDNIIINFCSEHTDLFHDQQNAFSINVFKHFCVYIYYAIGNMPVESIIRKMGISQSGAYYSIDFFKNQLDINPDFQINLDLFVKNYRLNIA